MREGDDPGKPRARPAPRCFRPSMKGRKHRVGVHHATRTAPKGGPGGMVSEPEFLAHPGGKTAKNKEHGKGEDGDVAHGGAGVFASCADTHGIAGWGLQEEQDDQSRQQVAQAQEGEGEKEAHRFFVKRIR